MPIGLPSPHFCIPNISQSSHHSDRRTNSQWTPLERTQKFHQHPLIQRWYKRHSAVSLHALFNPLSTKLCKMTANIGSFTIGKQKSFCILLGTLEWTVPLLVQCGKEDYKLFLFKFREKLGLSCPKNKTLWDS